MSSPPPPPGSPPPPPPYGGGQPPAYGVGAPPPPAYGPPPAPGAPPPYGVAPNYPAAYGQGGWDQGSQYAGFWARFGARLLDGLIIALISLPFTIAGIVSLRHALRDCVSLDNGDGTNEIVCGDAGVDKPFVVLAIVLFVIGAAIGFVIYCRWIGKGQSPGQKATGVRIVDKQTRQSIGTGRAVGRVFASILSGAVCYLGYLWMLWDKDKQTWHDKIVGSVVVKA